MSVQRRSYGLREEKEGGESGTCLGTTPKGGKGKIIYALSYNLKVRTYLILVSEYCSVSIFGETVK